MDTTPHYKEENMQEEDSVVDFTQVQQHVNFTNSEAIDPNSEDNSDEEESLAIQTNQDQIVFNKDQSKSKDYRYISKQLENKLLRGRSKNITKEEDPKRG